MSDFEDRLRQALDATAGAVDSTPRSVDAVLEAAGERRDRRRSIGSAGAGLVVLLLVTVALAASARRAADDDPATGPPTPAQLATRGEPTTAPAAVPTTGPRHVIAPTTTTTNALSPTSTTTAPSSTTTSTTDPRPLAQRVPAGVWIVGLDGAGLRRIGEAGRYSWSPDGTMLAIATDRIWILSARDGHEVSTVDSGPKGTVVGCLDWATTGTLGWVTTDGHLRFARMEDRAATVDVATKPSTDGYLDDGCRWSPDGKLFAAPGDGFAVYDTTGHRVTVATDPKVATVQQPTWSPDGRTLAALSFDHDGHNTGAALLTGDDWTDLSVTATGTDLRRIAWTADGHKLLLRDASKVNALDVATDEVTVATTNCCLSALTPLRDGNYLTVGGSGPTVRFVSGAWDPLGTLLTAASSSSSSTTTSCDGAFFASLRLSPDGREVAVEAQPNGGGATTTTTRCDKPRPY